MLPKRRLRMKVRATPEKGEGTGEAVVSTIGIEYEVGWGWTEQILAGCFDASIAAHPTIPIFYNHSWDAGPIGSGKAMATDDQLTVAFGLYLDQGDLVGRVYQAMQDGALEEWSIGFWAEEITWEKDNPTCDSIAQGDLAESSVCVRGANPETGTLELNGRTGWIDGDESTRKREVARLRSRYNVADLGNSKHRMTPSKRAGYVPQPYSQDDDELVMCPECEKAGDSDAGWCDQCGFDLHSVGFRPAPYHQDDDETVVCPQCTLCNDDDASFCDQCGFELAGADDVVTEDAETAARRRAAGHTHEHKHTDGTVHSHAHTHSAGNYEHDASDPEVTHAHDHPTPADGDDGEHEDPADEESSRVRAWDLLGSPLGRERLAAQRSSRAAPSQP